MPQLWSRRILFGSESGVGGSHVDTFFEHSDCGGDVRVATGRSGNRRVEWGDDPGHVRGKQRRHDVADCPGTTPETAAGSSSEPGGIEWTQVRPGFEEAYLDVPIDYADPGGAWSGSTCCDVSPMIPTGRVGSLLVNPGGPGFGGTDFVNYADQFFDVEVLNAFDIVGFDPRGTGLSEPAIDCIDDYDHFYAGTDITPDDDAERQQIIDLAEEFADACVTNNAEMIQFVGTNNAARDIDSIRRALGEEEISYVRLRLRSRTRRRVGDDVPDHCARRRVRLGASIPTPTQLQQSLQQAEGFENALTTYLAQCSADPGCAFHNDGDAEGAFDELMLQLDATPIPSIEGRPDVTRGVALYRRRPGDVRRRIVARAVPRPQCRPARRRRRPAPAVRLVLRLPSRRHVGQRSGGLPDDRLHGHRRTALRRRGRCHRADVQGGGTPLCSEHHRQLLLHVLPRVNRSASSTITGAGAGPILLCGTTGNAAHRCKARAPWPTLSRRATSSSSTPSAQGCSAVSQCADDLITAYLVDLDLPAAAETDCPRNS